MDLLSKVKFTAVSKKKIKFIFVGKSLLDFTFLFCNVFNFKMAIPNGRVASVLDFDNIGSKFKLQPFYYIPLWTKSLRERYDCPYPHLAMG